MSAGSLARQLSKADRCHLMTGPAKPLTQQLDQLHRQRRLASHKGKKVATIDDKNLTIGIRRHVGGPRQPVEHRDLPENLSRADQVQNCAAAVRGGDADLRRAADHRNQAVARISPGNDRGSPLQRGMLGVAAELVERRRLKIGEHRMLAQHRQLAARKRPSVSRLVLRHCSWNSYSEAADTQLQPSIISATYLGKACARRCTCAPYAQTS